MWQFSKSWYAVGLVMAGVVLWRLFGLYGDLPRPAAADLESGQLFRDLKLQMATDGRALLPPPDEALAKYQACLLAKGADCAAAFDKRRALLANLYYTSTGHKVLQEVGAWNHSRRFAAIRDDLSAENNRAPEEDRNVWQAKTLDDRGIATRDLVPLSFGFIDGDSLPVGFHDWASASDEAQQVKFCRDFDLKQPANVKVQLIGLLPEGVKPEMKVLASYDKQDVWELGLSLPKGKKSVCFVVATASMQAHEPADKNDGTTIKVHQVDGLMIARQGEQLIWREPSAAASAVMQTMMTAQSFQVFTRDGEALTETPVSGVSGQPSRFAIEQGLLGLVGQNAQDGFALSGLLAKSRLPKEAKVRLTLDSRWQRLAQRLLNEKFAHPQKTEAQPRHLVEHLEHSILPQRTALVLLNPKTGAILAAASTPTPSGGVHAWDRAAFSKSRPNLDPFQFIPWQATSTDFTPGSTFKLVTALAGLQASREDDELAALLRGVSVKETARILKMRADVSPWTPPDGNAVHNDQSTETLNQLGKQSLRRQPCISAPLVATGHAGLREALSESYNTWFAALAVRMDGRKLTGSNAHETSLLKMSQELGFREPLSLFPEEIKIHRDLTRVRDGDHGVLGRGDVLNALPSAMDLDNTSPALGSWMNRLARTSFGHSMSATPLQMARVAAMVSTELKVSPHLLQTWNGKAVDYPSAEALNVPNIKLLQEGMKAVTEQGTAHTAFKTDLACRVYGKTGTADVENQPSTAWFVGWLADNQARPQLAFACAVTRAGGYGGKICAPLIQKLLAESLAHPKDYRYE